MMPAPDSSLNVEIGIRAAMIAKEALAMLGTSPELCHFHLVEIVRQVKELDDRIRKGK